MPAGASLSLSYAFVPSPTPILASASGANPNTIDLQAIVSNPGLSASALARISIEIPTGLNDSLDISTAPNLPPPTYDTTIPWTIQTEGSTITIEPASGSIGTVTSPIVFVLPGIQVNETPGTIPITITEFPPPPARKVFDDTSYSLLKQPADFPITSFSVVPSMLTNLDQPVTLSWTCSDQGKEDVFGLRIASLGGGSGSSGGRSGGRPGGPRGTASLHDCVSGGQCYTWQDGVHGVSYSPVVETTTFALDAVQTMSNGLRTVVATAETTVQVVTPSISNNSYAQPSASGQFIWLHWLALNAASCTVELDGLAIDNAAPTDTYLDGYLVVPPSGSSPHLLSVIAQAGSGGAVAPFNFPSVTVTPPATVPCGGNGPSAVAITPDSTLALVANFLSGTLSFIDLGSKTVESTRIPVGEWASDVAITPDGKTAFVAAFQSSWVNVVDVPSRSVEANKIGVSAPVAIAITPDGKLALVSDDMNNQVVVIDVASRTIAGTAPNIFGPGGIAITPGGKLAIVTNARGDSVNVIDIEQRQAEPAAITVGAQPVQVGITPDGSLALVTNAIPNTVSVIDIATRKVKATIPVGNDPLGITITPNGSRAIVTNDQSNNLTVIDIAKHTTLMIPAGSQPTAVAIAPARSVVLVTNSGDSTVSFF
jgi:YVTN family beta-propeller protein